MWIIYLISILVIFIYIFWIIIDNSNEKNKNNKKELIEYLKNKNFKTSQIRIYNNQEFRVDFENKQIAICSTFPKLYIDIVNFFDIIECEIIEDSNTIMKGGIGRSIIGGVLAGEVGAIVASNTRESKNIIYKLQIRIITKNIGRSLHIINIIDSEIKKDSSEYKRAMLFANNVYATIISIINCNNKLDDKLEVSNITKENSNTDFIIKLEKLSKLKNDGVITENEFTECKQRILSENNGKSDTKIQYNLDEDIYNIEQKLKLYKNDKIKVISALKEENGLSLKDAKEIFDEYLKNR